METAMHGERSRGDYAHEPTCVAQRSESQDPRSHVSDWRACVITYHLGAGWGVHSESTGADAVQVASCCNRTNSHM